MPSTATDKKILATGLVFGALGGMWAVNLASLGRKEVLLASTFVCAAGGAFIYCVSDLASDYVTYGSAPPTPARTH